MKLSVKDREKAAGTGRAPTALKARDAKTGKPKAAKSGAAKSGAAKSKTAGRKSTRGRTAQALARVNEKSERPRRGTRPVADKPKRGAESGGPGKALATIAKPGKLTLLDRTSAAHKAYQRRQQRLSTLVGTATTEPGQLKIGDVAAKVPFVAILIGLLGLGLAVTLMLTTRAAEASYQLGSQRAANTKLAQQKEALQRDVQAADSAPDLAKRARDLGMIPAQDPARLLVRDNGAVDVVGTPRPASGAPAPLLNSGTSSMRSGSPTTRDDNPGTTGLVPDQLTPVTTVPNAVAPLPNVPSVQATAPLPVPAVVVPAPVPAGVLPATPNRNPQVPPAGGEQLAPVNRPVPAPGTAR